jgi:hypothetical protein
MAACAADAFCGSKLGSDPTARAKAAIAVAERGTCHGLDWATGPRLRELFGALLKSFNLRSLVPAITYRVLRCDESDTEALRHLGRVVMGASDASSATHTMRGRDTHATSWSELTRRPMSRCC